MFQQFPAMLVPVNCLMLLNPVKEARAHLLHCGRSGFPQNSGSLACIPARSKFPLDPMEAGEEIVQRSSFINSGFLAANLIDSDMRDNYRQNEMVFAALLKKFAAAVANIHASMHNGDVFNNCCGFFCVDGRLPAAGQGFLSLFFVPHKMRELSVLSCLLYEMED
jgi:hypothetical protein